MYVWNTVNGKKERIAGDVARYKIGWKSINMRFVILKPGEKYEVPVNDVFLFLSYLQHLTNGKKYELEVRLRDGYGEPDTLRDYIGRKDFETVSKPLR